MLLLHFFSSSISSMIPVQQKVELHQKHIEQSSCDQLLILHLLVVCYKIIYYHLYYFNRGSAEVSLLRNRFVVKSKSCQEPQIYDCNFHSSPLYNIFLFCPVPMLLVGTSWNVSVRVGSSPGHVGIVSFLHTVHTKEIHALPMLFF